MEETEKTEILSGIKLFKLGHIIVGTFFGGPLAAGILVGINYKRMGEMKAAKLAFFTGLIASIVMYAALILLPESFWAHVPNSLLPAIYTAVITVIVNKVQGEKIEAVLESGGEKDSYIIAAGWGTLCLILTLGLLFAWSTTQTPYDFEGEKLILNETAPHELYYEGNIEESTVMEVGKFLTQIGIFNPRYAYVAHLKEENGRYTLTIPILKDYWEDQAIIQELNQIKDAIAQEYLDGPLSLELCDTDFLGNVSRKEL